MTAQLPSWFDPNAPSEPKPLTRDELVLVVAKAMHEQIVRQNGGRAWDELPLLARDLYIGHAYASLDSAYPLVESAEEIEGLRASGHAVIVEAAKGTEWRRDRHGLEWVRLGANERLVRASSEQLAVNGPYVVVFRAGEAS